MVTVVCFILKWMHFQPFQIETWVFGDLRWCRCKTGWLISLGAVCNCEKYVCRKKGASIDWSAVLKWHLALSCLVQPQSISLVHLYILLWCVLRCEPQVCWCWALCTNFLQVVLDIKDALMLFLPYNVRIRCATPYSFLMLYLGFLVLCACRSVCMLFFCRLNMSNWSRLSAAGFDATAWLKKEKQSQSSWLFSHDAAEYKKIAQINICLSVITRASVMQVLAIAVCIMKNTKDRAWKLQINIFRARHVFGTAPCDITEVFYMQAFPLSKSLSVQKAIGTMSRHERWNHDLS